MRACVESDCESSAGYRSFVAVQTAGDVELPNTVVNMIFGPRFRAVLDRKFRTRLEYLCMVINGCKIPSMKYRSEFIN